MCDLPNISLIILLSFETQKQASEVTHWGKGLAGKFDNLVLISETHMIDGEYQLPPVP